MRFLKKSSLWVSIVRVFKWYNAQSVYTTHCHQQKMFTSHFSKLFTGRGYDNEFQILFLRIFLAIKTKLFVDVAVAVIKIIISYEIRKKIVKTNLGIRCRILSTAFYVTRNAKLRRKKACFHNLQFIIQKWFSKEACCC